MLQRLELADQLAELLALLEIVDGHVHRRRADADQLGRRAGAAGVRARATAPPRRRRPRRPPRRRRPRHCRRSCRAPMLLSARRDAFDVEALRVLLDREQGEAVVGLARATRVTSAEAPWTTNCLRPDRLKPLPERSARIAIASGRCLAPSSIASAATVSPARMPGYQRSRSAVPFERLDEGDRGGQEGRGRQVAADLLEHDPGLDMAEPEPAVGLVDQDAGEAHLGELLPQARGRSRPCSPCRASGAAASRSRLPRP